MSSNSTSDLMIFLCVALLGNILFCYLGYLVWLNPSKFKMLVEKRLRSNRRLLGGGLLEVWMTTSSYVWFVKILTLAGMGMFTSFVIMTLVELFSRVKP
jgi:hypothetical protein